MDELDYAVRLHMMQDLSLETVTVRHDSTQRALPMRQYGSFLPGSGVGGAGEHWNGICPRFLPDCFELFSRTVEKYGAKRLPADHAIQDWGVTYDEMEPYYTRAERMLGISGKAGNIREKKIAGGNVFEGWRSAEYPTPPTKIPYFSALFSDAAKALGYPSVRRAPAPRASNCRVQAPTPRPTADGRRRGWSGAATPRLCGAAGRPGRPVGSANRSTTPWPAPPTRRPRASTDSSRQLTRPVAVSAG